MKIFNATALAVTALFTALSANAAIVTFDFTLNRDANNNPVYNFNTGGVNLSVEAWSTTDLTSNRASQDIRQNGAGLGVEGNGSTQINTPDPGFNVTGIAEWLSFSTDIGDIVGVGISSLGPGEEVDFWGSNAASFNLGNFDFLGTLGGVGAIDVQNMSVNLGGQPWLMVASSVPMKSGFRVASIDVELPEPGTMGLLGLGLMGVAWIRRRAAI